MTSLRLGARHACQIHTHLCRAYPEEGCGVLLGRDADGLREIERVIPFENESEDARHQRFAIAPERFLAAEREGREAGLEVLGFFHSHPDRSATPSAFDLGHAWPYYSYLIVSLTRGRVVDARSWRLSADRSRFEPETLETSPAEAPAVGRAGAEPSP